MSFKIVLVFQFLLFGSISVWTQDTLKIRPYGNFQDLEFLSTCAHDHICCAVGCSCCRELNRSQQYDTTMLSEKKGVKCIRIAERYQYAREHELMPIHYRFISQNGKMSPKWFDFERGQYGHYYSFGRTIQQDSFPKNKNRFLVMNDRFELAYLNELGEEVEMPNVSNERLNDSLFLSSIIVLNQRYFGLTDGKGQRKGPINLMGIEYENHNGNRIFTTMNGKKGVLDQNGTCHFTGLYDDIKDLNEGCFEVKSENQHVIIDWNGNVLFNGPFQQAMVFSEGLSFVKLDEKNGVYIDKTGKKVIKLTIQWGSEFSNGFAAIQKNDKWGYIDRTGKLVIDCKFYKALNVQHGVAPVATSNNYNDPQWRLIDTAGNFISEKSYYQIGAFKNGLAKVFINGQGNGMINTKGEEVIPPRYFIDEYGTQNDWFVFDLLNIKETGANKTSFLVNRKGEKVVDLSPYISGRFVYSHQKNMQFLPYIHVYTDKGEQQIVDLTGKPLLNKDYKSVQFLDDQIIEVRRNNKTGFVWNLATNKVILEFSENQYIQQASHQVLVLGTKVENEYSDSYSYFDYDGNLLTVFGMKHND